MKEVGDGGFVEAVEGNGGVVNGLYGVWECGVLYTWEVKYVGAGGFDEDIEGNGGVVKGL